MVPTSGRPDPSAAVITNLAVLQGGQWLMLPVGPVMNTLDVGALLEGNRGSMSLGIFLPGSSSVVNVSAVVRRRTFIVPATLPGAGSSGRNAAHQRYYLRRKGFQPGRYWSLTATFLPRLGSFLLGGFWPQGVGNMGTLIPTCEGGAGQPPFQFTVEGATQVHPCVQSSRSAVSV